MERTLLDRLRSLPFFWLSLACITGIVLASQVSLAYSTWAIMAGIFLLFSLRPTRLAGFLHLSSRTYLIITLSLVSFCLGGFNYQIRIPKIDAFHIAWYNDREYDLLVTGTLSEPPDYRDTYTNLHIKVDAVDTGSGDLLVEANCWHAFSPMRLTNMEKMSAFVAKWSLRLKMKNFPIASIWPGRVFTHICHKPK